MSKVSVEACQIVDDDLYSRLLLLENVTLELTSWITKWRNYTTQVESSSNELANLSLILLEMVWEILLKDPISNFRFCHATGNIQGTTVPVITSHF